MSFKLEFTIHTVPVTLNKALRGHWRIWHSNFESIKKEIRWVTLPSRPAKPLGRVSVVINRHSPGKLDRDNKFFTAKAILDGLVECGVLVNDTEDEVVSLEINQIKCPKEGRKIDVNIEELSFDNGASVNSGETI